MNGLMELAVYAVAIGVGATLVMDLWSLIAARVLKFPAPNYALVGRWVGHMPRGRFVHPGIAGAAPVGGERLLGWATHYTTGVLFAALLLALTGVDWVRSPTPLPALGFGLITLTAPFFLMQPGMGAGIASSRTPNPTRARLRSLMTHTVFGLGLYVAALVVKAVLP